MWNKLILAGLMVVFSPYLMVFCSWAFSGFSGSLGEDEHGVYFWAILYTVPIGTLIMLLGFVGVIVASIRRKMK